MAEAAVTVLTIDARGAEDGAAAHERASQRIAGGVDKVVAANDKAQAAITKQTAILTTQADSVSRQAAAFDRYRAAIDPVIRAEQELDRVRRAADASVRQGRATQEEATRVVDSYRERVEQARGANDNFAKTNDNVARSAGLARYELINLSRQAQDVVVSLQGGQSFSTVLLQQGSQIGDVFASSQATVGNAVRSIVSSVAGLLSPARLAFGGVALAAAGAGYALNAFNDNQRAVETGLRGLGRESGATVEDINRIAAASASASNISVSAAREMATAFAATGRISAGELRALTSTVHDFAATTGDDLPTAAKALTAAFGGDLVKGFDALNARLNFGTAATRAHVEQLQAQGKNAQAASVMLGALKNSLVDANTVTATASRLWSEFWNNVDKGVNVVGRAAKGVFAPDLEQQLARAQGSRDLLTSKAAGSDYDYAREIKEIDELMGRLNMLKISRGDTARAAAEAAKVQRESIESLDAAKRFVPDAGRTAGIERDATNIRGTLDANRDSGGLVLTSDQAATLEEAATRSAMALRQIRDAGGEVALSKQRLAEAHQIEIASIGAVTVAQQAEVASLRAVFDARGRNLGAADQALAAERARQVVLAQSAAETAKVVASQNTQLGMSGRLIAAAGQQGAAGVSLNAQLQEELKIRQSGITVLGDEERARIANAGAVAQQALAMRDAATASETRASGRDQIDLIKLETQTIGLNDIERQKRLSTMQGEIQARALERQGLTDAAAATRESTAAIAQETAVRDRAVERLNAQKEAQREATTQRQRDIDAAIQAVSKESNGSGFTPQAAVDAYFKYGVAVEKSLTGGNQFGDQKFTGSYDPTGYYQVQAIRDANYAKSKASDEKIAQDRQQDLSKSGLSSLESAIKSAVSAGPATAPAAAAVPTAAPTPAPVTPAPAAPEPSNTTSSFAPNPYAKNAATVFYNLNDPNNPFIEHTLTETKSAAETTADATQATADATQTTADAALATAQVSERIEGYSADQLVVLSSLLNNAYAQFESGRTMPTQISQSLVAALQAAGFGQLAQTAAPQPSFSSITPAPPPSFSSLYEPVTRTITSGVNSFPITTYSPKPQPQPTFHAAEGAYIPPSGTGSSDTRPINLMTRPDEEVFVVPPEKRGLRGGTSVTQHNDNRNYAMNVYLPPGADDRVVDRLMQSTGTLEAQMRAMAA